MRTPWSQVPRPEALAAVLSLAVGVVLLVIKFVAYAITGSAAVFSDAMESVVNVLASAVALGALTVAHRPADPAHPWGYGKAEFLSAGLEGGMVLLAGVAILVRTLDTVFFHSVQVAELDTGLALVALAMAVNAGVGLYLVHVGRRRTSVTLEADGQHLLSDALTSVAALLALAVVRVTGWVWADAVGALVAAVYIIGMGGGLVRRAAAGLMDVQDGGDQRTIRQVLDRHVGPAGALPRICGHHQVRHLHSGRFHWVEFHVQVPATLTVEEGHRRASALQREITGALGEGRATAHVEPCTRPECPSCAVPP